MGSNEVTDPYATMRTFSIHLLGGKHQIVTACNRLKRFKLQYNVLRVLSSRECYFLQLKLILFEVK